MIDLKKCNYITADNSSTVSSGFYRIIRFLELMGKNPLLLSSPLRDSVVKPIIRYVVNDINIYEFKNLYELEEVLSDRDKLFRVDLLVIDLWGFSLGDIIEYKMCLDEYELDYMIISDKYHYIMEDDDTFIYKVTRETKDRYDYTYSVTEVIGGWTSTIDDLKKSYIRDRKIDDIFGDSDI